MQTTAVWGIAAEASQKRVALLGALSLLLHALVLSPIGALLGLWALQGPVLEEPPVEALTEIPVSLLDDFEGGGGEAAPEPLPPEPAPAPAASDPSTLIEPKAPAVAPPKPKPKPPESKPQTPDAGAAKPPATEPKPEPVVEAESPKPEEGPPKVADPVSLVGSAVQVTDSNANVRLLLYTQKIRGHLLGERIGRLFANLPQWQSFLGGGDLDIVRDVDTVYLAGPQFRRSDQVATILEYNVSQARVRAAIDHLVKRDKQGRWLEAPFPAALATADRAERLFALPREKLAVVSPPATQKQVLRDGPKWKLGPPKGEEAVIAYVKTPWRVLLGTQLGLPQSIEWAKLRVIPLAGGDVLLELLAQDASADEASRNAKAVSAMLNDAAQLGGFGSLLAGFGFAPLIDRVELHAKDTKIHGKLHVTAAQLKRILGYIEAWAETQSAGKRRPTPTARPPRPKLQDEPPPLSPPVAQPDSPGQAGAPAAPPSATPTPAPTSAP